MKRPQQGFAVMMVALVLTVALAAIVITSSTITTGVRITSNQERRAYQALLAAESGINTFAARVNEGQFTGTPAELACWVQGTPAPRDTCQTGATARLGTLHLTSDPSGPRTDIQIVERQGSTVTLRSTGREGPTSNLATATVLQDFILQQPTYMNIAPPAVMTSCPPISTSGGGNATLSGRSSANTASGVVTDLTSVTSATPGSVTADMALSTTAPGWPATLTVQDGSLLNEGSFVRLAGHTYRVTGKTGTNTVTVAPADARSMPGAGATLQGSLASVPLAVRAAPYPIGTTTTGHSIYRIPVSDPTGFFDRDVAYFTHAGLTYGVTVIDQGLLGGNVQQGYIDVTLGATGAGASLYDTSSGAQRTGSVLSPTEIIMQTLFTGTPLWRYIPGATSAANIGSISSGAVPASTWGGNSSVTPAAIAGNGVMGGSTAQCRDGLFTQVFPFASRVQYYNLTPEANRLTSTGSIPNPLPGGLFWLGGHPASTQPGSYSLTNGQLCGSGILVVYGTLAINGTCSSGFNGLLYIIGDLRVQGNTTVNGAVAIEGAAQPTDTSLGGTLRIDYTERPLMNSSRLLSPFSIRAVQNTWRQQ